MLLIGLLSNHQSPFVFINSHLSTLMDTTGPQVFISPFWRCLSNSRPAPVGQLSCCATSADGTGPSSWAEIDRWHPASSWHQQQEHELLSASVSYSPAGDWKKGHNDKRLHLANNTSPLLGGATSETEMLVCSLTWSSHIVGLTSSSQSALPSQSSTAFVPSQSVQEHENRI